MTSSASLSKMITLAPKISIMSHSHYLDRVWRMCLYVSPFSSCMISQSFWCVGWILRLGVSGQFLEKLWKNSSVVSVKFRDSSRQRHYFSQLSAQAFAWTNLNELPQDSNDIGRAEMHGRSFHAQLKLANLVFLRTCIELRRRNSLIKPRWYCMNSFSSTAPLR